MPDRRWEVGDRVVWPHREGVGRARRVLHRSAGTVVEVDAPGVPPGARVQFDHPVNGVMTCYATHRELEPEAGGD